MGNIFNSKSQFVSADSCYGKYVDIWYKTLKVYYKKINNEQEVDELDEILVK